MALLPFSTLAAVSVALFACNGPAFPERDGRVYLESKGYSVATVEAVLNGGRLRSDELAQFRTCRNADVRHLVARNATLTQEEIEGFVRDSNDYVRSGATRNRSLTLAQMERLAADSSHTVYAGLARNPSVPKELLLRLHHERRPGLVCFAMNSECPPEIVKEIENSGDDLAKSWLKITRQKNR
jgi:hypothetical protein